MGSKRDEEAGLFARWQPRSGDGEPCALRDFDPGAKPFSSGDKARDKALVETLARELDTVQDLFYADRRFKMLVVLQGIDGSGKDGTLRGVFGHLSPLGVYTVGWTAPSTEERSHDYLWRIHRQLPADGQIAIFNRSHYEDVLVPVVNGGITPLQARERYRQINDFERMLAENGTVILKFMLHISKDEQRERMQDRVDDVTKHWKFRMEDLAVRAQWDAYMRAYEALLGATSTTWAPWTIVPADSKTHRNLMVAKAVHGTLHRLGLRYPPSDPRLKGLVVK